MTTIFGKHQKESEELKRLIAISLMLGTASLGCMGTVNAAEIVVDNGTGVDTSAGVLVTGSSPKTMLDQNTISIGATTQGASGLAATNGATITFTNTGNVIQTTTGATVANVNGIYADNGTVTMTGGKINITGTTTASGIQAKNGSTVTLKDLGANFTVAATKAGAATGVTADGTNTTVKVSGTDLNNIGSIINVGVRQTFIRLPYPSFHKKRWT